MSERITSERVAEMVEQHCGGRAPIFPLPAADNNGTYDSEEILWWIVQCNRLHRQATSFDNVTYR